MKAFALFQDFQSECENRLKVLDEAANSASKMTVHAEADEKAEALRARWLKVNGTAKEWVARMSILVECWNKLEGNVDQLNSWVTEVKWSELDVRSSMRYSGKNNFLSMSCHRQHQYEHLHFPISPFFSSSSSSFRRTVPWRNRRAAPIFQSSNWKTNSAN